MLISPISADPEETMRMTTLVGSMSYEQEKAENWGEPSKIAQRPLREPEVLPNNNEIKVGVGFVTEFGFY